MELHEVLRKIALELGDQALSDSNIVNVISDYDSSAFEPQSLKNILKLMVSENFIKRVLTSDKTNETDCLKLENELIKKYGFQKEQVEYIIDSFKYGLSQTDNIIPYSRKNLQEKGSVVLTQYGTPEKKVVVDKGNTNSVERHINVQSNSQKRKISTKKHSSASKKSSKNGCGCLIIGFIILGIIGAILGNNESESSPKGVNSTDTIFLVRKEMDTVRYNDGTPKKMELIEKHDIKLVLGKDSLLLITPYECMYPSICFDDGPTGSFYNKLTKEFKEELVYEFQSVREKNKSYIYSLPRDIFPSFKDEKRLCDVWFFYIPVDIAKKNMLNNTKYDSRINLDLLEGTEAVYKCSFSKYEDYESNNKLLKAYFSF